MRFAFAAALLSLLAHAAHARDAREEVRTGVLRAIGYGIAYGGEVPGAAFLPACGDSADLRASLPDARAPWRAGYPHPVRSEPAPCLRPQIDGPR